MLFRVTSNIAFVYLAKYGHKKFRDLELRMLHSQRKGFKKNYTDLFLGYRRGLKIVPRHNTNSKDNIVTALSDNINIQLSILDRKITELSELFVARLRPTFDNAELELCDHNIRQTTNEISNRITSLTTEIKHPINTQDPEVASLLINLQQCHKLRLSSLVQRFRNLQATRRLPPSLKTDSNSNIYQNGPNSQNGTSDLLADFNTGIDVNSDPDSALLSHHNQELEQMRDDDLGQLVTMMNELNSLFRDMSLLIFEQGTMLDRIDTKIELAVQDVQRGNDELEQANEHQSSNCFYYYIFILVGLITICLLIMIFRKR